MCLFSASLFVIDFHCNKISAAKFLITGDKLDLVCRFNHVSAVTYYNYILVNTIEGREVFL